MQWLEHAVSDKKTKVPDRKHMWINRHLVDDVSKRQLKFLKSTEATFLQAARPESGIVQIIPYDGEDMPPATFQAQVDPRIFTPARFALFLNQPWVDAVGLTSSGPPEG